MHANQSVGAPRPGRNIVGAGLKINDKPFARGLGCFAPSLQEFALSQQFKAFTADVGVDAATEGKARSCSRSTATASGYGHRR